MCGLSGILQISNKKNLDLLKVVSLMNESLTHRGPDDRGTWIDDEEIIAFSHSRLSILELSKEGKQPMLSKCGRFVIIFNGEIYNHKEIRNEIENIKSNFEYKSWKGKSDTETILAAISIWGFEKSIKKFIGMFSIACWDLEKKELFLTRDRIGEKPLYYGLQNDLFVFSSELKAFKEVKDFPLQINKEIIPLYLARSFIPAPFSIYKNIYKLKPGTYLRINQENLLINKTIKPITYWDLFEELNNNKNKRLNLSDQKQIKKIDYLLRKSISSQMLADVPIGAFLSGGIDSSLVVSIMQSISSEKVKTFSLGFSEVEYDESIYAKKIAEFLGTDHSEYKLTSKEAIKLINNLPNIYDEPFSDVSQIPMIIISQIASKKVKVCLSGDGGDELFGGYNRYIYGSNLWKIIKLIPLKLRQLISKFIIQIPFAKIESFLSLISLTKLYRWQLNLIAQKFQKFAYLITAKNQTQLYSKITFENNIQDILSDKIDINLLNYDLEYFSEFDASHNMMFQDMKTYLPDDVLLKVDRAAMHSSLETRMPMLDINLINFAWQIPISKKIKLFKGKWLLRKLLKKYLPSKLFERPKSGFSVPIGDWLKGPLKNWAEKVLKSTTNNKESYFNQNTINLIWKEHISGKKDWSNLIWSILVFQVWLDKNK